MSATSGIKKVKKVISKKSSAGGAEITTETTTITTSQETSEYGGGADRLKLFKVYWEIFVEGFWITCFTQYEVLHPAMICQRFWFHNFSSDFNPTVLWEVWHPTMVYDRLHPAMICQRFCSNDYIISIEGFNFEPNNSIFLWKSFNVNVKKFESNGSIRFWKVFNLTIKWLIVRDLNSQQLHILKHKL